MMENIFFSSWESTVRTAIIGVLAYFSLIFLLRITGKRTLSQMKEFDFIVTVALGSTLATVLLNKNVALIDGFLALAMLVFLQYIIAWLSVRSKKVEAFISSEPTLVFFKGKFLQDTLRKERLSESEVRSALRGQGVYAIEEVDAVVFESNGKLSVIKKINEHKVDSSLADVKNKPDKLSERDEII